MARTSRPRTVGDRRDSSHRENAPERTLRTIEYAFGYEPGAYIGLISPTPLLLIVAVKDHLAVSDLAIAAYQHAYEPKRLVLLPGGHFDAYVEGFDQSLGLACDWFLANLGQ